MCACVCVFIRAKGLDGRERRWCSAAHTSMRRGKDCSQHTDTHIHTRISRALLFLPDTHTYCAHLVTDPSIRLGVFNPFMFGNFIHVERWGLRGVCCVYVALCVCVCFIFFIPLPFNSIYLLLCVAISLSISPYIFLFIYFYPSLFPSRLSCVHSAPLKAGLHVLVSDWPQSKKMMSFLVGRCVSPHMHRGGRIEGRDPGS